MDKDENKKEQCGWTPIKCKECDADTGLEQWRVSASGGWLVRRRGITQENVFFLPSVEDWRFILYAAIRDVLADTLGGVFGRQGTEDENEDQDEDEGE